jgi:hypothetical protein
MKRLRAPHLTVLALVPRTKLEPGGFFRYAENMSEAVAGNANPIVHTVRAFDPTARQAAQETA